MTTIESLMLTMCFGVAMGTFAANVVTAVHFAIEDYREKRRSEKEEPADKAE